MRKASVAVLAAAALASACGSMHGQRDMHGRHHGGGHGQMMARMDANGDGMLSKEEFMRAHEAMFDRMKGPNGMISLRDMPPKGMGPGPAAGTR